MTLFANAKEKTRQYLIQASGRLGLDVRYFIKGGFWLSLPFIFNNFAGLIRSAFFARLLTQDTYGQFGFVNDLIGTLSLLTLPGISAALIETVARGNHGAIFDAARARARWGSLLSLGVTLMSLYYLYIDQPTLALALFIGGILHPFAATFQLIQVYYNGRKRFDKVSLLNIGQTIVNLSTLLLVLWLKRGLVWLVIANFGSNLLYYFVNYQMATRHLHKAPRDLGVVPYGRSLTWAQAIMDISTSLDGVVLGLTGGFVDVAVYRIAAMLPKSAKGLTQILRPLVMPKIAEHPDKRIYTHRTRRHLFSLLVLNLVFVGITMVALHFLIPFIYGDLYKGSVIYAQLLMLSLVMGWPTSFFTAALEARKQTRAIYHANLIHSILLVGSLVTLVPFFGIMGIIISRIASRWGMAIFKWHAVSKI